MRLNVKKTVQETELCPAHSASAPVTFIVHRKLIFTLPL